MERECRQRSKVQTWNPLFVLNGSPLPSTSSIKDLQLGKVGYMANAVKQALLPSSDMVDLRSIRKHEVFLSLKRDLALVIFFLLSIPITFFPYHIVVVVVVVCVYNGCSSHAHD